MNQQPNLLTPLESVAIREKRSKGRRHPGGCGSLLNSGYCGLDWHANGKPVVCWKCRKIKP